MTHFDTDYGVDLQKQFFAHFLKGENNGWDAEPPVRLQIRHRCTPARPPRHRC